MFLRKTRLILLVMVFIAVAVMGSACSAPDEKDFPELKVSMWIRGKTLFIYNESPYLWHPGTKVVINADVDAPQDEGFHYTFTNVLYPNMALPVLVWVAKDAEGRRFNQRIQQVTLYVCLEADEFSDTKYDHCNSPGAGWAHVSF